LLVVIRTASLHAEVDEAYDLAAKVFGPSYPEAVERLTRIRSYEGLEMPSDVVVARAERKIVGMAHVLPRPVYIDGRQVSAWGIGHVCVHPSYQGYGYGRGLVLRAIQKIREHAGVLAIVIARRKVDGFYPKYGFVGVDAFLEMAVACKSVTVPLRRRIRYRVNVLTDRLVDYAKAYAETYSNLPFAFCRAAHWWTHLESRLQAVSPEMECVNVYLENRWLGYFILHRGVVIEAASDTRHIESFAQAVVHHVRRTHGGTVRLALTLLHPCIEYLRNFVHTINLRFAWNGGHMIRVLDKRKFLKSWPWCGEGRKSQNVARSTKASAARFNVTSHEGARKLVMAAFGMASSHIDRQRLEYGEGACGLLGLHPVWSILDEF